MGDEVTVGRFSWGAWTVGLLIALVIGGILDFYAEFLGMMTQPRAIIAPLIGILPGLLFALIAFVMRRDWRAFAMGLFTGACVVALVGGLCAVLLTSVQIGG